MVPHSMETVGITGSLRASVGLSHSSCEVSPGSGRKHHSLPFPSDLGFLSLLSLWALILASYPYYGPIFLLLLLKLLYASIWVPDTQISDRLFSLLLTILLASWKSIIIFISNCSFVLYPLCLCTNFSLYLSTLSCYIFFLRQDLL